MPAVPVFPLPMVLLPRTVELLHIFEPRYRTMLDDCLAADGRFGILWCPSGTMEAALEPGHIGCMASIETVQRLPDGRSNIAVRGTEVFRFLGYTEEGRPYRTGAVESRGQPAGTIPRPAMTQLVGLFERAFAAIRALVDDSSPAPDLPSEDVPHLFAMAQLLEVPPPDRQLLLASGSASELAERLDAWLRDAIPSLESRARRHVGARSNGHGHA